MCPRTDTSCSIGCQGFRKGCQTFAFDHASSTCTIGNFTEKILMAPRGQGLQVYLNADSDAFPGLYLLSVYLFCISKSFHQQIHPTFSSWACQEPAAQIWPTQPIPLSPPLHQFLIDPARPTTAGAQSPLSLTMESSLAGAATQCSVTIMPGAPPLGQRSLL